MFSVAELHTPLALLAVAALGVVSSGCAAVGRTKEPPYTVSRASGDFEVRSYPARAVAQTEVAGTWEEAGNEGFRRLAGYIFGKNKGRAKIAMTAPVGQRTEPTKLAMTAPVGQTRSGDVWTITFTMPEGETLATLPEPDDARVVLREAPPVRVAVVRFRGRWSQARMDERTDALRSWTQQVALPVIGEPEVNRYDPPFMPWFLRRNEVWLQVGP
jgi:hypothetical protein